jgi:hypothetical protein
MVPPWVHALVILLMIVGVALATTVTPWGISGVATGAAALVAARRWDIRRRARLDRREARSA